jgi:hypothetical protein
MLGCQSMVIEVKYLPHTIYIYPLLPSSKLTAIQAPLQCYYFIDSHEGTHLCVLLD